MYWAKPTALFTAIFLGKSGLLWGMSDSARECPAHPPVVYSPSAPHAHSTLWLFYLWPLFHETNGTAVLLFADRLMGYRENARELTANQPHVLQREAY